MVSIMNRHHQHQGRKPDTEHLKAAV
jgi:hypothetical protein